MAAKTGSGLKEYFALVLVLGSFLILMLEVVFRYFLGSSLDWTDEISRILLVWMSFSGMGFVIRDKKEIVCEAFGQKLPKRMQRYWSLGIDILVAAFTLFLFAYGIRMTLFSWDIKTESMEFPFSYFYGSIPVGCLLMLYFLGKRIKADISREEKKET
ncbi:MAG: TRAP transporter small permease [Thermodesulfobacteriota bacterium]